VNGDQLTGELIATASHELRQPLASIKGFTEMLLGHWADFPEEDKLAMLKEVLHEAERVGRLIDELLEASRLGSGQLRLHVRDVDLTDLVERVTAKTKLSYPAFDVVIDLPGQLPAAMDPFKVEQVLSNLLENACKYGSAVGVRVSGACVPGHAGGEIAVEVMDSGPGISPEDLPRVTEKFFRGAHSKPSGLGLGLWISKGIVEAHGGTLSVSSTPGEGTAVRFTIPLRELPRTGKLSGP
jgi:signal transduction histidine kinase